MSLSVDYLYKFCLALIRKSQAGGVSSNEFEIHWNDQSNAYMDDLLGRFQNRTNSKLGSNTGLIENETILTKLTPFTHPVVIPITNGQAIKPDDFVYTLALRINDERVYQIDKDQIYWAKQNVIDPPSIVDNTYYYTEYENYYSFLPETVTSVSLDYIATPKNVVWGFTLDANGRQIYNPGTSVQPKWSDNSCREITKRMLSNLGISFKDADFANFGKSVETTGE